MNVKCAHFAFKSHNSLSPVRRIYYTLRDFSIAKRLHAEPFIFRRPFGASGITFPSLSGALRILYLYRQRYDPARNVGGSGAIQCRIRLGTHIHDRLSGWRHVLQWLLGPLSDRVGRRPVMLTGVLWFIVTCLATLLAQNIVQFTFLRFAGDKPVLYWCGGLRRHSGIL